MHGLRVLEMDFSCAPLTCSWAHVQNLDNPGTCKRHAILLYVLRAKVFALLPLQCTWWTSGTSSKPYEKMLWITSTQTSNSVWPAWRLCSPPFFTSSINGCRPLTKFMWSSPSVSCWTSCSQPLTREPPVTVNYSLCVWVLFSFALFLVIFPNDFLDSLY